MMYARDFRASARAALKGKWVMACLAGLIACILGAGTLAYSGGAASNGVRENVNSIYIDEDWGAYNYPNANFDAGYTINPFLELFVGVTMVLIIAYAFIVIVIGSAVDIGYKRYHLAIMDGDSPSIGVLFSGFSIYGRAFLLRILTTLYIFFWSMLLVIPGLIKSYSYSMAPYILAENPDMGANEAITASRELMDGNKWRLFCLEISFLGWSILAMLTCGLGSIPLEAYMSSARAAFYREISQTWKAYVDYDNDFVK